MPRNVRPAWLDLTANGTTRGAGPKARTGRLAATLYIRDTGTVLPVLDLDAGALGGDDEEAEARIRLRALMAYVDPVTGRTHVLPTGTILSLKTTQ